MLLINQDTDPMIAGSYGRRRERTLERRGIADATAGRSMASDHPIYQQTYRSAALIRRVERGELVFCLGEAVRCRSCGEIDVGHVLTHCSCPLREFKNDERGLFVMHGKGSTEEDAPFRSHEYLRDLTACGLRIETLDGEDVTHLIHPLQ